MKHFSLIAGMCHLVVIDETRYHSLDSLFYEQRQPIKSINFQLISDPIHSIIK